MNYSFLLSLALLSLSGCSTSVLAAHDEAEAVDSECNFRRGEMPSYGHCDISIFQLVSSGRRYLYRRVFTIAYALDEGGDSLLLAPTPDALTNGDFLSCVVVPMPVPERRKLLSEQGIYVIEIAGVVSERTQGWCKIEIRDATLMNPRQWMKAGAEGSGS